MLSLHCDDVARLILFKLPARDIFNIALINMYHHDMIFNDRNILKFVKAQIIRRFMEPLKRDYEKFHSPYPEFDIKMNLKLLHCMEAFNPRCFILPMLKRSIVSNNFLDYYVNLKVYNFLYVLENYLYISSLLLNIGCSLSHGNMHLVVFRVSI